MRKIRSLIIMLANQFCGSNIGKMIGRENVCWTLMSNYAHNPSFAFCLGHFDSVGAAFSRWVD